MVNGKDGKVYFASSKNKKNAKYCQDRRRKRSSNPAALLEAYDRLYSRLINLPARENFLAFDLDKDGRISFEETMLTMDNNNITTAESFKEVDSDKDGFVLLAKFDSSLNI